MNNEFYCSRIRGVFESRFWLQLNLICSVLATGLKPACAQALGERKEISQIVKVVEQITQSIIGLSLLDFLNKIATEFKERPDYLSTL
jgi:hypothetical protein